MPYLNIEQDYDDESRQFVEGHGCLWNEDVFALYEKRIAELETRAEVMEQMLTEAACVVHNTAEHGDKTQEEVIGMFSAAIRRERSADGQSTDNAERASAHTKEEV